MAPTSTQTCPLCLTDGPFQSISGADQRSYFLCPQCWLIFADSRHHLSAEAEAAHYRTHENSIHNPGYVRFLRRVVDPMLPHLNPGMKGLDYGCGPGPTLSELVRRQGIACQDYDPLFVDVPFDPPYDFVFSTECLEHFCFPHQEICRIAGLLRPGGWLGIMTECWEDPEEFSEWYYTRDPTHVSFYHLKSWELICSEFGFELVQTDGKRVFLLRRS